MKSNDVSLPSSGPVSLPGAQVLALVGSPARETTEAWLLRRYWWFALLIPLFALPLLAVAGSRVDVFGIGAYFALTVVSFVVSRVRPAFGERLHLLLLIPYWGWYSAFPGSLPSHYVSSASDLLILLVFPLLTLVTLDGARGAALAAGLLTGVLFYRFDDWAEIGAGGFIVALGLLVGLVFRSLARSYEGANELLRRFAFEDALTGLLNRRGFTMAMKSVRRSHGALLFLDLDRFKTINDVFGHMVGDELLVQVAARIADVTPELPAVSNTVARIGGDEFVVVLDGCQRADAEKAAQEIVHAIEEPFDVSGRVLHVGVTVGVALWPERARSTEVLLRYADSAMYAAKKRGVHVGISGARGPEAVEARQTEVELGRGIREGELELWYQPVLNVVSNELAGVEALVRWRHADKGLLLPAAFIEIAEETGQIVAIDRFALEEAARFVRSWQGAPLHAFVAVNMSARSLDDPQFFATIADVLQKTPELAGRLVLELTESATMRDPAMSARRMAELREMGVSTALDDFGMGYSSLAYLKSLPATHLKLDRAFTAGIGRNPRDEDVCELVLGLGAKFGIHVVAEGVETAEQLAWLEKRGCPFAQGYAIARPLPREEALRMRFGAAVELAPVSSHNMSNG